LSSGSQARPQIPLRKKWPGFKRTVSVDKLKEEAKERFGYEPHKWQLQAALKVLDTGGRGGLTLQIH